MIEPINQLATRMGLDVPTDERRLRSNRPTSVAAWMLIQRFHPFVGGAERQLQALSERFPAHGVSVRIITRRLAGPDYPPFSTVAGAEVYRIRNAGGYAGRSLSYTIGALWLLWRRRRDVDVLHAHELLSPATTAVLAKLMVRRPVVVKVLRGGSDGDVSVLRSKRLGSFRLALLRRLVDRFICINGEIADELLAAGVPQEHLIAIPNGVDSKRFTPATAAERLAARHMLGIADKQVVMFAGRLAPEKGLDILADAWSQVLLAHPNAQLAVLGTGPMADQLARRALPGLRLFGVREDMARCLQAADVFVLPSAAEGLSNALLEAMSSGLTCVATEVGAAGKLLGDDERGLLVPPGNAAALAAALNRALADDALRTRLGTCARAHVVAHYSLDSVTRRLRALYDDVIADQGAPATHQGTSSS
ncbi:MAG TPA: glycosyltransferase family 4 protein [Ktedonobacterales bacterium]